MKLIIVLSLALTTSAFAKAIPAAGASNVKSTSINGSKNASSFNARNTIGNIKTWVKNNNKNFRIGIAQGSLNANARSRSNGSDQSISESRSTRFQIQAGWETIKTKEVGYSAYLTYQDIAEALGDDNVRSYRVSGNATYGINKQAYTYGGLNWNKYYGSTEIEEKIDAGLGYQIGLGFKFHEKANVEMEYLTLLNEGRIDGSNIDIETKGIMIKINTPLTFNL